MDKPSIIAVITARQHSKRLPDKALADICGQPMLMRVVERVKLSCADDVIVATTKNSPGIISMCEKHGVKYYVGDEDDQLTRIAQSPECDYVARIWGDSPLVDHYVITLMVSLCQKLKLGFIYNEGFAQGQRLWVAKYKVLQNLNRKISKNDRYKFNEIDETGVLKKKYKWGILRTKVDESKINLSVDTKEDLEKVRKIWEKLEKSQTTPSGTNLLNLANRGLYSA